MRNVMFALAGCDDDDCFGAVFGASRLVRSV